MYLIKTKQNRQLATSDLYFETMHGCVYRKLSVHQLSRHFKYFAWMYLKQSHLTNVDRNLLNSIFTFNIRED